MALECYVNQPQKMEVETFNVLPLLRCMGDPGLPRDQGNMGIKVAVLHPLAYCNQETSG